MKLKGKGMFYSFILAFILAYGCSNTHGNKEKSNVMSKVTKGENISVTTETENEIIGLNSISIDSIVSNLVCRKFFRISEGALQSLHKGQHSELYRFGQCNEGKESFEVIWVLDKPYEQRTNIIDVDFYNNVSDSIVIANFITYLFKLPLNEVTDPLLDDPYTFPADVEVFALRNNKKSEYIGKYHINSWDNYIQLQYKTIFR